jgi:hypothetical protein
MAATIARVVLLEPYGFLSIHTRPSLRPVCRIDSFAIDNLQAMDSGAQVYYPCPPRLDPLEFDHLFLEELSHRPFPVRAGTCALRQGYLIRRRIDQFAYRALSSWKQTTARNLKTTR